MYRATKKSADQPPDLELVSEDGGTEDGTDRDFDSDEWKQHQLKIAEHMALEKLRDAVHLRERTILEGAIDECQEFESLHDSDKVKHATFALEILQHAKDLKAACDSRDIDAIKSEMKSIREAELVRYLDAEMIGAKYLLEALQKKPRRTVVLDLDKNTMSEIRRYQNPPAGLHQVMQAVWLLLGEDEDTTDDWRTIQRLSNPHGQSGLRRKLLVFDASKVNPEMAARSKQILDSVDISKVGRTSAAASTFYVWAMGMSEGITREHSDATPANRQRQKELLGRLPPPVARMDRLYYKSLAAPAAERRRPRGAGGSWPAGRGYTDDNMSQHD